MDIYEVLNKLNIKYEEVSHEKVFTIDDINKINVTLNGIGVKNLFLKDLKNNYYLLLMVDDKKANLKSISNSLYITRLSFADAESLYNILKLEKGSVTPLGIINDEELLVKIIIDKELVDKKLLVHPNRNDRTITIDYSDLIKFINYCNHDFTLLDI